MIAGGIALSEIEPARWQTLAARTEPEIQSRYKKIAEQLQISPRQDVVQAYQSALKLSGNVQQGKAHFQRICAACHRLENMGHEVGPNLMTFKARGPETILLNVLDPNREVNPQFINYLAVLEDGRTLNGMIASETATSLTLKRAENATDVVTRSELEELQSTRQSIMPEGLEKQLDPQALADVIAYLMSLN
jgi:putative heme-binding domain-containing protein